jgi:hypothetical protein
MVAAKDGIWFYKEGGLVDVAQTFGTTERSVLSLMLAYRSRTQCKRDGERRAFSLWVLRSYRWVCMYQNYVKLSRRTDTVPHSRDGRNRMLEQVPWLVRRRDFSVRLRCDSRHMSEKPMLRLAGIITSYFRGVCQLTSFHIHEKTLGRALINNL